MGMDKCAEVTKLKANIKESDNDRKWLYAENIRMGKLYDTAQAKIKQLEQEKADYKQAFENMVEYANKAAGFIP